jgi:cytochrome c peroxidase
MRRYKTIWILAAIIMAGTGWVTADNAYFKPKPLAFIVPKGWPKPSYDFSKNPLTEEGFKLGKKLFYDGRLSKDGNFSCGSCHQQFGAFDTYDHNVSHGFNNSNTTRNSPGLFNLAWQKEFMWDGGINHLDLQPLAPITAENEMGENIETVISKLRADREYRKLFKAAFGDESITYLRLGKALSQFLLQLVSSNSKYDKVMRGQAAFILPEKLGYEIFQKKCIGCHTEPMFTDYSYRNTGLTTDRYVNDFGRMKITGDPADSSKFRVPSLRNVALTFPYGHDGRFFSLMNVFEHYRKNMVADAHTDPLLKNRIGLSNFEIGQLTAFLYTLTDSVFIKDPRFAPPGYDNSKPPADIHQ